MDGDGVVATRERVPGPGGEAVDEDQPRGGAVSVPLVERVAAVQREAGDEVAA